MTNYFDQLPLDAAEEIEQLSRLSFQLREDRKVLLQQHNVDSEDTLLDYVRSGSVAEHPGYDHYLSARVLAVTQEAIRNQLKTVIEELAC